MKLLSLFSALFAVVTMPVLAMEYTTFSLENGMDVYVIEDHRAPVAINFVWYKTGAADEKTGETGIAHMLEHLMFKGTENIAPQEFSKIVARNGGKDNAFTSQDYTAYYQKVAVDNLEKMMEIESDRMRGLTFGDAEFLPERDVVMEERRWRVDTKPLNRFFEEFSAVHMPNHPYGRPVIGWKKDIEAYTSESARNWYTRWYQPNNATLIIIGDVHPPAVRKLVEKTYGSVPSTKQITHDVWPTEPLFTAAKRFKKVDEEVKTARFYRMYRVPSVFTDIAANTARSPKALESDSLKLSLLAHVLGGSDTSPLYKELVEKKKLAVNVSARYSGIARGESTFDLSATAVDGVTLTTLEKAMDAELKKFIQKGISADELARAKTGFKASGVYAQDDLFYTSYRLGRWLTAGGSADSIDKWQTDMMHITVDDLLKTAQKYLSGIQHTTALLVNNSEQF